MLLARLTCLRSVPLTGIRHAVIQATPALRPSTMKTWTPVFRPQQNLSSRARFGRARTSKDQLMETAFKPTTDKLIKIDGMGRVFLAGGAVVGLGALCYYGLGMSNEVGAFEKSMIWPQYVKDRIRSTYMYFAGSVGLTALSVAAVMRTPALMGLMMRVSWVGIGAAIAAQIAAGMLVRSISYEQSPVPKHLAWMLYAGVMGVVLAPITCLGGALMMRAAWYTAGIVGGLSTLAMCAPSEKFLNIGGPLAAGFGVVFASSIGSMFLPPTSVFGAGLYSVAVYGGLVLFSVFLLYDTQKVIKRAETYPLYGVEKYDPINGCMGIYMDTLNIFIRLVMILSGGRNKSK